MIIKILSKEKLTLFHCMLIIINVKSIDNFKFEKKGILRIGSHLLFKHVKKVCSNGATICKSNDTNVCSVRYYNGTMDYLDFENACFLFIKNMCESYEHEYFIISSGTCFDYFKSRRNNPKGTNQSTTVKSVSTSKFLSTKKGKPISRNEKKYSSLYEVDTAFDYHTCPLSCPDVYSPVCININRGHGLYFKFLTFINHCAADLYYCKNWREFSPPPDEQEIVTSSQLSWSMCAANRYIQFARFTEMTSSMGHYGWLAGDYRPSYILEPHERMPGYG